MVGCGFDADVVRRLHATRTGHIRHWSYIKPILGAIRSYQYPAMRVYCGDSEDTVSPQPSITAKWVFTFNLPCYAGGLGLAPWADGQDGALEVCTFARGSFPRGLVYLAGVVLGRHRRWRDCVTTQARWLRIESDAPVPYQVDGDPGGDLPLTIQVLPNRLTLLAPKS
jgi:diacylglycerol kinase family enzyme